MLFYTLFTTCLYTTQLRYATLPVADAFRLHTAAPFFPVAVTLRSTLNLEHSLLRFYTLRTIVTTFATDCHSDLSFCRYSPFWTFPTYDLVFVWNVGCSFTIPYLLVTAFLTCLLPSTSLPRHHHVLISTFYGSFRIYRCQHCHCHTRPHYTVLPFLYLYHTLWVLSYGYTPLPYTVPHHIAAAAAVLWLPRWFKRLVGPRATHHARYPTILPAVLHADSAFCLRLHTRTHTAPPRACTHYCHTRCRYTHSSFLSFCAAAVVCYHTYACARFGSADIPAAGYTARHHSTPRPACAPHARSPAYLRTRLPAPFLRCIAYIHTTSPPRLPTTCTRYATRSSFAFTAGSLRSAFYAYLPALQHLDTFCAGSWLRYYTGSTVAFTQVGSSPLAYLTAFLDAFVLRCHTFVAVTVGFSHTHAHLYATHGYHHTLHAY